MSEQVVYPSRLTLLENEIGSDKLLSEAIALAYKAGYVDCINDNQDDYETLCHALEKITVLQLDYQMRTTAKEALEKVYGRNE